MATVTSDKCSAGVQPHGLRVGLVSTTATYSPNGSMSTGDVIQMIKVPKGAQVVDLKVAYKLTGQGSYIVGDGISTSRYMTATLGSVAAGIGVMTSTTFTPYTYSTDDTIDITLSTSVNPSSGSVIMIATINLDP